MALEESPREDLLREATALVERVELVPCDAHANSTVDDVSGRTIIAGFRSNGALSIFFGDDEVYHFNSNAQLRRAYVDGRLYKAVKAELVALTRVRTAEQVELRSRQLSATERGAFVTQMKSRLTTLATALAADRLEAHRQVPTGGDVLARLRNWLASHTAFSIAARPNA